MDRLRLPEDARFRLNLLRGVIHTADSISRVIARKPFFGLREAEALRTDMDFAMGAELVHGILDLKGGTKITAYGAEHVPKTGPALIASTHPTGAFDYFAHTGALLNRRPDLKVVANEDMAQFLGHETIIPVRITKQTHLSSKNYTTSRMHQHLEDGGALLIFGSGRVPDRKDGKLVERNWRSGATRVSQDCNVEIIPAAVNAQNSSYYYGLRNLAMRLSGNPDTALMVASLRYVAEMLDQLGGSYDVHYTAPLPAGTAPEHIQKAAEGLIPDLYEAR
ncbi:Acyltransferase [Shimia gijangensis]|uniref:Acyltransferase n=1 Tax=Shimia gijangensis TaxID=1470563 RepID=A0A1M6J5P1_9RHOB|nr:1-acyl-sn-glycerol-3-phosphate acyltransferase [Shimia gijangensis]SHJ41982.1 Acyltransferase [Shimia gijangensis]